MGAAGPAEDPNSMVAAAPALPGASNMAALNCACAESSGAVLRVRAKAQRHCVTQPPALYRLPLAAARPTTLLIGCRLKRSPRPAPPPP